MEKVENHCAALFLGAKRVGNKAFKGKKNVEIFTIFLAGRLNWCLPMCPSNPEMVKEDFFVPVSSSCRSSREFQQPVLVGGFEFFSRGVSQSFFGGNDPRHDSIDVCQLIQDLNISHGGTIFSWRSGRCREAITPGQAEEERIDSKIMLSSVDLGAVQWQGK